MPGLRRLLLVLFASSLLLSASSETIGDDGGGGQVVYVVYLGQLPSRDASEPEAFSAVESTHHDMLNQILDDGSSISDRILRSYKKSFNGFAARLTDQEAQKLSSMDGVVSVFPSRTHKPLTTRSWDFLGFPRTPQEELPLQGEVIVGMLDTGLWPHSPSFSDEGFGPPPSKWKGVCQNFTCNNKIIGARAYYLGSSAGLSPLDDEGHGSHTASTVAGRSVGGISLSGLAAGTARGAVPGARLAIYKVCWPDQGCDDVDILAAFDDAIADGVDVISFSIGSKFPGKYFEDSQAIGSFHAMKRGVLTSASAGNSGLTGGYVCNVAPWMLSVAASTIDRRFLDRIILGNGKTIVGTSINTFPTLHNAALAFPTNGSCESRNMTRGSYKGKIVLCPRPDDGSGPLLAGAAGVVTVSRSPDVAFILPLPGLFVTQDKFNQIMAYFSSTRKPVGTIDSTETTVDPQAPVAASFSSPGPNQITPGILKVLGHKVHHKNQQACLENVTKLTICVCYVQIYTQPDLSAPGIDIIASWTLLSSPTNDPNDKRRVPYNIISGTSMACPHVSGAAAYVKSFHRGWSPAMIMSALITTATPMNTPGNSGSNAFKYGAGQLNPAAAHDPGLVYDASESDYVAMLCAQGYNAKQLALITGSHTYCNGSTAGSVSHLNYPTMAARIKSGKKRFTVAFPRTVTNVGAESDVYDVKVVIPAGAANELAVAVSPSKLEFSAQKKKASFTVTVSGTAPAAGQVRSAAVVWYNKEHEVRSPVVVYAGDSKGKGF